MGNSGHSTRAILSKNEGYSKIKYFLLLSKHIITIGTVIKNDQKCLTNVLVHGQFWREGGDE